MYIREWGTKDYARALVYGQLASKAVRASYERHLQYIPVPMVELLFAVRKCGYQNCMDKFSLPPRYSNKVTTCTRDNLINEVINCFGGELPTLFAELYFHADVILELLEDRYFQYFNKAICLDLHGRVF